MSETFSNIVRTNNRLAPTAALHVEVIADLVCPFCYLGKRRLEQALDSVQGPSEVSWYPYQLNPDMPAEGMSLDEYLSLRFGNSTRCNRLPTAMRQSMQRSLNMKWPIGCKARFQK